MKPNKLDTKPPARIYEPTYRITRIPGGWQIRLGALDSTFYYSATFYDSKYGDQHKSLAATQRARNKQIKRPEYIQWISQASRNSTGFLGIGCDIRWQWDSRRDSFNRRATFWVRDQSVRLPGGQPLLRTVSFVRIGAWYGYRQAVRMRADMVGERVSARTISQRYDEVFLEHWKSTLEEFEIDWRRV